VIRFSRKVLAVVETVKRQFYGSFSTQDNRIPCHNPLTRSITFSSSAPGLFTRFDTGYASIPSTGYG
jgi:hypothetical protein